MFKKIFVHTRKSIKLLVLLIVSLFLIVGLVTYIFKPTYRVILNGKHIGYTANKSKLQAKINDYIKNGDGQGVAYVQMDQLPEYQLCLLKKGIVTNDEEIYDKVKNQGSTYYRYYAISANQEEKVYVSNFEEAESVINTLKEKNSSNINTISVSEKYETDKQEFKNQDEAVSELYVEPVSKVAKRTTVTSRGTANTSYNISGGKADIGINLIRPVNGIITSRFGESSSRRYSKHTGLDIATSTGTPIRAAAAGTVTFAGRKGSYGNLIILTHENGVQTYYGHCNSLKASVGQQVSQGSVIATVGNTGNSTGPHLHLEIRKNGVAYNPQNYLY